MMNLAKCFFYVFFILVACKTRNDKSTLAQSSEAPNCGERDYSLTLPGKEKICALSYSNDQINKTQIGRAFCLMDGCSSTSAETQWENRYDAVKISYPLPKQTSLSEIELMSLLFYSMKGYLFTTETLYKRKNVEIIEPIIRGIISALNKLPIYRGLVFSGKPENKEEFDTEVVKGKPFFYKKFFSTSVSASTAQSFAVTAQTNQYAVIYQIDSHFGRDITTISSQKDEKEILFHPSFPFIVEKIEDLELKLGTESLSGKKVYLKEAILSE